MVSPASRSARVSPTQMIGDRPARNAARAFRLTAASSSPNSWRRSEWPMMTCLQPASASCDGATSPVNAPFSSQKQSCAATVTGPSSRRLATAYSAVKLGETATSTSRRAATPLRTSVASANDSAIEPLSFQFPQKNARRAAAIRSL
jgi:hypothetical protein